MLGRSGISCLCVAIPAGDFTIVRLLTLLGSLIIYKTTVLFGFDWASKNFSAALETSRKSIFVCPLALFLAAVGAQLIGVEKIVGALSCWYSGE